MEKFRVTFWPDNKSVEVAKDTTILAAAITAGAYINSVCGGDGVCGRCKVIVKKGKVLTQPTGIISLDERKKGIYLACLTTVHSDLEVEIPPESRLSLEGLTPEEIHQKAKGIYGESEEVEAEKAIVSGIFKQAPLTIKLYLEIPQPNLDDKISDLERLVRQIKRVKEMPRIHTGLTNVRELSELLRSCEWKVTVTVGDKDAMSEILLIEPGNTSLKNFGFCFDIGTTTITGQLVDLNSGETLGTKATYNKQIAFGSDVITRIIYAKEQEGLEDLHLAVADCKEQIIHELVKEHHIDLNDVTCVLCAGNTTMIHLLLCIDPTYIRKEPYVPTANFIPAIRASEAGIKINPKGLLTCVPGVASYVGGDITAGILSCGLEREEDLCVLIDIGTNGEIALGNKEFFIACAASAGPAFEGSGVSSGMRAGRAAIQKAKINPQDFKVNYTTIGGAKPRGICGSGYIEIIAEMLRVGILDKDGKIKPIQNKRVRNSEAGREFVIAFKEETDTAVDIVITEADIDNLKRAKAAIYSATASLIRHMRLDFAQVKKFFIAGAFGTSIDVPNAIAIGLLPDLEKSRFIFVGNSSLAGARQMLLSEEARRKADAIAKKVTYFELSVDPDYMDEYMAALFFPHTDLRRFPSVKI